MEKQTVESAETQNQEQEKGLISRRKLLASLGMAGVALASSGLIAGIPTKAYAAQADNRTKVKDLMNLDLVVTTTVAELRANTQPAAELVYYVKDSGMEGAFYYDSTDTSTLDNTGTVLVSTSGARFKRIFDGPVQVKWFGTKGMELQTIRSRSKMLFRIVKTIVAICIFEWHVSHFFLLVG